LDMTLFWDARARVATAALRESQEGSHFGLAPDDRLVTLYLPDLTIHAVEEDGGWVVIDRDVHNLGVVPVIRMANRQRTADR
ncbi:phage capsid protein, partial [Streptomyces sp. A73]|nr:phage capsid protein [Streptomyces sp. A73]